MAEPTCQKCGGHDFDYKDIGQSNEDEDYIEEDEDEDYIDENYVFIIFCKDCGWIAGCGGG